jgi:hypothetical protein
MRALIMMMSGTGMITCDAHWCRPGLLAIIGWVACRFFQTLLHAFVHALELYLRIIGHYSGVIAGADAYGGSAEPNAPACAHRW